ncbi:MAG: protein-glutamate O-methyltransferase CheR [Pseudomonadales bacterium]
MIENQPRQAQQPLPEKITDNQFVALRELAMETTGIELQDNRKLMLYSRLARRLSELNMRSFDDYISQLKSPSSQERTIFANKVTTNLTYFFREPNHFQYLVDHALPALADSRAEGEPLRIWSAGCSTGQEPYSLAITAKSVMQRLAPAPRILCTDINTEALDATRQGCYLSEELRGLTLQRQKQWFTPVENKRYQAQESLREMLIVKQLNFFDPWPIRNAVEIIFCRNVMIYFGREAQEELLNRFANLLKTGGYLFLGHSETLQFSDHRFERVAPTVYQRKAS